jgi:hypothetical protein
VKKVSAFFAAAIMYLNYKKNSPKTKMKNIVSKNTEVIKMEWNNRLVAGGGCKN